MNITYFLDYYYLDNYLNTYRYYGCQCILMLGTHDRIISQILCPILCPISWFLLSLVSKADDFGSNDFFLPDYPVVWGRLFSSPTPIGAAPVHNGKY